jgi:hypothetical protein
MMTKRGPTVRQLILLQKKGWSWEQSFLLNVRTFFYYIMCYIDIKKIMQPRRKKLVLLAKRTSQICEIPATIPVKDLTERNYLTMVRLCSSNENAG